MRMNKKQNEIDVVFFFKENEKWLNKIKKKMLSAPLVSLRVLLYTGNTNLTPKETSKITADDTF